MEALSPVASKLWIPCARRVAMTQRPRRMKSPMVSHSHRAGSVPATCQTSVIVEKREGGRADVEATIKIHVGGERIISTAEGNGPVNALDTALRQAIAQKHPHLSDGDDTWGSIGVSENIIEASWEALVDSIEYGMVRSQKP
jgi:hypothetical protein